jgi:hypothetical protein
MRKVITIYLAACCIGSHSCKQHENNDGNDHFLLVQELRELSEESNLSWNIEYREALILSKRPMGYVFEYGANYLHYDKDTSKSKIRIHVGVIFPKSITPNKNVKLCLDNKMIDLSELDILRKNKDTGVSEIDLYFDSSLDLFLESDRIYLQIYGEKDLLISDKRGFDEKLKNWHQKGEEIGKFPDGVLVFPVKF